MTDCIPLMKQFGKKEPMIQEMTAKLKSYEQRDLTFKEFQEKKKQLDDL